MVHEGSHYDVIVVGAGPAGAAFVRSLTRDAPALRVLAIEKRRHPRDKVCGDALTFLALPLIRELFPELGSIPTRSFTNKYRFYYPNGRYVGGTDGQLDVIPRRVFDHALWNAIKSEVAVLEDASVIRLNTTSGRVTGVHVEHQARRLDLSASLVVGADGSTSVVRMGTGQPATRSAGVAIRQYVSGLDPSCTELVFLIDPQSGGYLWIFPFEAEGERWANLGYFCQTRRRVNLGDRLALLRQNSIVKRYLAGTVDRSSPKGFPLNLARRRWGRLVIDRPLYGPGYVLVGDAAGLIEPHTGEGIAFALHSGRVAGQFVAGAQSPEEWGPAYQQRVLSFVRSAYPTLELAAVFQVPGMLPPGIRELYMRALPWLINRRHSKSAG